MINFSIKIELPILWGSKTFSKNEWSPINLIVGPNGTGKSLFAEHLKAQLAGPRLKVRFLNAERLAGFEKQNYTHFSSGNFSQGLDIAAFKHLKTHGDSYGLSSSAFVTLRERLDIRIKIEALLSDIFKKTIRLVEEGGYLRPKIQNLVGGNEYNLKETECHGIKELLTLLTFLYDDSYNCLVLDEPELHLHPQFQSFLLTEMRKIAGNPLIDNTKKMFFVITHSPYFLDLRELQDLKGVLVCHYNEPPTFIDHLSDQEVYVLKRFLPRFNTHHKQFFFSTNPVFVEGHTDQQIVTILFDRLDYNVSASGSCIIDVGGKDELAVFFTLCKKIGLKARIIADLDALFKGKLREVFQQEDKCNSFLQGKGLGIDLSLLIGDLEQKVKAIVDDIVQQVSTEPEIIHLVAFLKQIFNVPDKRIGVITSMIMALQRHADKIEKTVTPRQIANVRYVIPRLTVILQALEQANVYILPKGEIEHYYTQSTFDYLSFDNKDLLFHTEREYILSASKDEIELKYPEITSVLKKSVPTISIDLGKHLKYQIIEWIQSVQRAISKGDVSSVVMLKANAKVDYALFSQIIEIIDLTVHDDNRFLCKIKINNSLSPADKYVEFDEKTIPHEFKFLL